MRLIASLGKISVILLVFLIGAAAGALIIYGLNYGFFSARPILVEFDKKFQEKIKAGSLWLSSGKKSLSSLPETTFLSGAIEKINPDDYSFLLKAKNIYYGGSIADFALKQEDFYEVKVLVGKDTMITDADFSIPLNKISEGQDIKSSPDSSALSQSKINAGFQDLKKNQNVNVVLSEAIELSETPAVNADLVFFGQAPDAGADYILETRLNAKFGDDASKYEKFLVFDALFKTSGAFVGLGTGSGGNFYGYGGLNTPSAECLAGGGRPIDSVYPGPCDCSSAPDRWACFNSVLVMSSWGRARVAPNYKIDAWGWGKDAGGNYSLKRVEFRENDTLEVTYSTYFMDKAQRSDGQHYGFAYLPPWTPPYLPNPGFSYFEIYRRVNI